jgi:hypothetical protein
MLQGVPRRVELETIVWHLWRRRTTSETLLPVIPLVEERMSIQHRGRGRFALGLLTGVLAAVAFASQQIRGREGCEPVVDVQYKRIGKNYLPETVVRQPMREGDRCVLAEAGG